MWLIALKGLSGSGKSTLGSALSKRLGWPLIDKDDVKDLLDGSTPEAGGLSYDIMFTIARRQLLQGLNVICDSPLVSNRAYQHARDIAAESSTSLAVVECQCSDEWLWSQRINARKTLQLSAHHQTDWDAFLRLRPNYIAQGNYSITDPLLVVDTARPFQECLVEIIDWIEQLREALLGEKKPVEKKPAIPPDIVNEFDE
jgi:predicted kinase